MHHELLLGKQWGQITTSETFHLVPQPEYSQQEN